MLTDKNHKQGIRKSCRKLCHRKHYNLLSVPWLKGQLLLKHPSVEILHLNPCHCSSWIEAPLPETRLSERLSRMWKNGWQEWQVNISSLGWHGERKGRELNRERSRWQMREENFTCKRKRGRDRERERENRSFHSVVRMFYHTNQIIFFIILPLLLSVSRVRDSHFHPVTWYMHFVSGKNDHKF